jgi:nicotinic acid mononucleotide adenylyltransferase
LLIFVTDQGKTPRQPVQQDEELVYRDLQVGNNKALVVYNQTMSTAVPPAVTERNRRRQVCLFGTSANPPTGDQGHGGIVRVIASLVNDKNNSNSNNDKNQDDDVFQVFDEIRVVPVYSHPFASKHHQMAPFEHRVAMCQLAFASIGSPSSSNNNNNNAAIIISEAERDIYQRKLAKQQENFTTKSTAKEETVLLASPPSSSSISIGTADLLEYYHETDAVAAEYTLCLGEDTFLDLMSGKWRRTEDILDMIQGRFVVLGRPRMMMITDMDDIMNHKKDDDDYEQRRRENQLKLAISKLEESFGTGSVRWLQLPSLGAVSSTMVRTLSQEIVEETTNNNTTDNNNLEHEQQQKHQEQQQQAMEEQMKKMVDPKVLEYMKKQRLYGFQQKLAKGSL